VAEPGASDRRPDRHRHEHQRRLDVAKVTAGYTSKAADATAKNFCTRQKRAPHSESSANHPVPGPAQQLRCLVHLINGDQHDVAVEAGRDLDRHIAGCERRNDRSQHAGRVRRVRLVAIPQRHPSVVGRILASHASSAVGPRTIAGTSSSRATSTFDTARSSTYRPSSTRNV
jgi:hypothetical protein